MTDIAELTIPAEFVRLDDATTQANAYAHVRQLQRMRLNHNKLLARAVRRQLFSIAPVGGAGNALVAHGSIEMASILEIEDIPITPYAKEVTVVCRARTNTSSATPNVTLYPSLNSSELGAILLPFDSSKSMVVNSTLLAKYTVDITIPQPTKFASFSMLAVTPFEVIGPKGSSAIASVGPDWFTTAASLASVGDYIQFTNTSGVANPAPRTVVSKDGATFTLYMDRAFDILPIPGTHTAIPYDPQMVHIETITAYEKEASSF